jgi:hypothetical protein
MRPVAEIAATNLSPSDDTHTTCVHGDISTTRTRARTRKHAKCMYIYIHENGKYHGLEDRRRRRQHERGMVTEIRIQPIRYTVCIEASGTWDLAATICEPSSNCPHMLPSARHSTHP